MDGEEGGEEEGEVEGEVGVDMELEGKAPGRRKALACFDLFSPWAAVILQSSSQSLLRLLRTNVIMDAFCPRFLL